MDEGSHRGIGLDRRRIDPDRPASRQSLVDPGGVDEVDDPVEDLLRQPLVRLAHAGVVRHRIGKRKAEEVAERAVVAVSPCDRPMRLRLSVSSFPSAASLRRSKQRTQGCHQISRLRLHESE